MLLPVEAFERLMSDAPAALSALQVRSGEAKGEEARGKAARGLGSGARGQGENV